MIEHGANRYSHGCRCDVCRAAKTAYNRRRRAVHRAARLAAEARGERYVAEGITHGVSGYKEFSCRCMTCRLANANQQVECRNRRKAELRAKT